MSLVKTGSNKRASQRSLRFLLLDDADLVRQKIDSTKDRIRHFSSLTGGCDIAIVLLMGSTNSAQRRIDHDNTSVESEENVSVYCELECFLAGEADMADIPILLCTTPEELSTTIRKYVANIQHQNKTPPISVLPVNAADVMSACTMTPPLQPFHLDVAMDLFPNVAELAEACIIAMAQTGGSSRSDMNDNGFEDQLRRQNLVRRLEVLRTQVGNRALEEMVRFWTV